MHEFKDFKRGDLVSFKGDGKHRSLKRTYIYAFNYHEIVWAYIQHPEGYDRSKFISHPPFEDGFEAPFRREFKAGLKYIAVYDETLLEKIENSSK